MDKIKIKDLEVFARHGVFPEENFLGQKFVISATLHTSTRKAGLTDELEYSIHYGEVSHLIKKIVEASGKSGRRTGPRHSSGIPSGTAGRY